MDDRRRAMLIILASSRAPPRAPVTAALAKGGNAHSTDTFYPDRASSPAASPNNASCKENLFLRHVTRTSLSRREKEASMGMFFSARIT